MVAGIDDCSVTRAVRLLCKEVYFIMKCVEKQSQISRTDLSTVHQFSIIRHAAEDVKQLYRSLVTQFYHREIEIIRQIILQMTHPLQHRIICTYTCVVHTMFSKTFIKYIVPITNIVYSGPWSY